jgi:hypothetical protein
MNHVHVATQLLRQRSRVFQNSFVERCRLVVCVPRIHGSDEPKLCGPRSCLRQQQRYRTRPNEMPIRVREKRALREGMMVCVLDDQIRCRSFRTIRQSEMQRIRTFRFRRNVQSALTQRLRKALEHRFDIGRRLAARAVA